MIKQFGIVDLYQYYGNNRQKIEEVSLGMTEKKSSGLNTKFKLPGNKTKVMVFYDDITIKPSTFEIDFLFNIVFDSQKIHEDFVTVGTTPDADLGSTEKDLAVMAMKRDPTVKVKKFVDYERFYIEVIRKMLAPYKVSNKVRDLQNAGVFSESLGDFKITDVNLATVVDEKVLFKKFIEKDRKNSKLLPLSLQFGYAITISDTNKARIQDPDGGHASKEQVKDIAIKTIPTFEKNVLVDTKYYRFGNKQQGI